MEHNLIHEREGNGMLDYELAQGFPASGHFRGSRLPLIMSIRSAKFLGGVPSV